MQLLITLGAVAALLVIGTWAIGTYITNSKSRCLFKTDSAFSVRMFSPARVALDLTWLFLIFETSIDISLLLVLLVHSFDDLKNTIVKVQLQIFVIAVTEDWLEVFCVGKIQILRNIFLELACALVDSNVPAYLMSTVKEADVKAALDIF